MSHIKFLSNIQIQLLHIFVNDHLLLKLKICESKLFNMLTQVSCQNKEFRVESKFQVNKLVNQLALNFN